VSNLVRVVNNPLTTIVKNQLAANVVVGFTAYMTACVIAFHDEKEYSRAELLKELYSASYATWKWYMGLGPQPEVKTGLENG
jgi:hypothetical protein